jgi:uncharacterized protein (DUF302 family)
MKKLAIALVAVVWSFGAFAQALGMATIQSKYSVAESMDRVEAAVKAANGFQIFARIDFQAISALQGGKIRPSQLLIFGRGTVLQTLLSQNPATAIDLPLKILAWEDENGKAMLSYNTGDHLAQRHALTGKEDALKRITDATASFAKSAGE